MLKLVLGLVLFLGMHSVSIFALPLRDAWAAKNELVWKLVFSVASILGLYLIATGYADARMTPTVLYVTPAWLNHVAALLLLPVFVLLLAPYLPGRITRRFPHPLLLGVKLWAACHLLVNGTLADILLFGAFLAWAVLDRISLKRRPARPLPALPESGRNDVIVVLLGVLVYAVFVLWLHEWLIGVRPVVT